MGCLINSPKLNNYAVNLDKCICLIHSIILNIPLLRELFLALGCNKATHDIFDTLLKNKNNIFLCPGGINEMVNTYKYITANTEEKKNLYISTKHKGFIKQALKNNKRLIPVLSFGEQELLSAKPIFKYKSLIIPFVWGKYCLPVFRDIPITGYCRKASKI